MIRRRWVVRDEKDEKEPAMSYDGDSSSEEELARLRLRVAELEAELAARPPEPRPSGNLAPLAFKLLGVEAAMILVCLLLAIWCAEGQITASGWLELAYVAGLVSFLAVPFSVSAVNALILNLWTVASGPRLLIAGSLSIASIGAVVWQWWLIDIHGLSTFTAGAMCMLFVPALGLRWLARWRLQLGGDPLGEQHAAPRTFDLLLLTVVFAIGVSIIRHFFQSKGQELSSGYLWWLAGINSLLPATVVCLGAYCSLRMLLGPRRSFWFPAAVLVNMLAGGVFLLQIASSGFAEWPPVFWPGMVSVWIDGAVLVIAIGTTLALAPLVTVGIPKLTSN